jgi:hypothetical protein
VAFLVLARLDSRHDLFAVKANYQVNETGKAFETPAFCVYYDQSGEGVLGRDFAA